MSVTFFKTGDATKYLDVGDDSVKWTDGTRILEVNTSGEFRFTDGTRVLGVTSSGPYVTTAAGTTPLGGVSSTRGAPLALDVTVTWESTTGAIATVPAGERWIIDAVRTLTTEAWDGGSAQLDIGVSGTATGFISAATLTAAGAKGYAVDERGSLLWDSGNTHAIEHPLAAAATVIATVDAGSTPSEGITRVFITGWRFAA
jgi:hypothetical protein